MYTQVLAALDIESPSDLPLITASRIASEHQASLRAVAVVRTALLSAPGFFSADVVDRDALIREAKLALNSRVNTLGRPEVGTDVQVGQPSECIVKVAEHRQSDLIVVGAKRREGSDFLLGTTATNILRLADEVDIYACHRLDADTPTSRLVIAIDGSKITARVLAQAQNLVAASETQASPCEIQVVCVLPDSEDDAEQMLENCKRCLLPTPWAGLIQIVEGDGIVGALDNAIQEFDADLLIIGSGENIGIGWALGSTTNSVLHEVSCDVLVVRP